VAGLAAAPAMDNPGIQWYVPDIETFMQIGGNYSPQVSRDRQGAVFQLEHVGSQPDVSQGRQRLAVPIDSPFPTASTSIVFHTMGNPP